MVKRRQLFLLLLIGCLILVMAGCDDSGVSTEEPTEREPKIIVFAYPEYLTYFAESNYQALAESFNENNPDLQVVLRKITTEELMESGYDINEFFGREYENMRILMFLCAAVFGVSLKVT